MFCPVVARTFSMTSIILLVNIVEFGLSKDLYCKLSLTEDFEELHQLAAY
jgi:hypothetical protein